MISNEPVPPLPPLPPMPDLSFGTATPQDVAISLDDRVREFEASLIAWALRASGGNKSKAAALLRIKRSTLGDRINRCGLGRRGPTEVAV